MVHDPRVSLLLARLGGLYRDPSKVDRAASTLLKSSVGTHLAPGIAPLVENNGEVSHCLVLQGTIAWHFRGNTYQQLLDLYLPAGYPQRPPVAYVRLTDNMYLKENHMHVGSDGKVYLPYLHEWNPRTHNLVELVVAMSSVFSADPPVFTRAPTIQATPTTTTMTHPNRTNTPPPPMPSGRAFDPPSQLPPPPPPPLPPVQGIPVPGGSSATSEAEARLAREAEEANRVMEAARRAEREEQEREEQLAAQQRWEAQKKEQVKQQVLQKIIQHLETTSLATKQSAQDYKRDQQRLTYAEEKCQQQLTLYQQAKDDLVENVTIVDQKTAEIQAWLSDAEANANSTETAQNKITIDDMVAPTSAIGTQMLDLSVENASLTDALYFLDRALYLGNLDCDTHLKYVRRLAKQQFLARALLIKINQQLLKHNPDAVIATASF